MLKKKMIPQIMSYIRNSYEWHSLGEVSEIKDGPGLLMIELEESILSQFGLPPQAFYFSEILQQEGHSLMNIGHRAEALYDRLIEEANAYLLSPPPRDINVLMCAKETMADSQEVLPFIGFQTTIYTNFLYYDIYNLFVIYFITKFNLSIY